MPDYTYGAIVSLPTQGFEKTIPSLIATGRHDPKDDRVLASQATLLLLCTVEYNHDAVIAALQKQMRAVRGESDSPSTQTGVNWLTPETENAVKEAIEKLKREKEEFASSGAAQPLKNRV